MAKAITFRSRMRLVIGEAQRLRRAGAVLLFERGVSGSGSARRGCGFGFAGAARSTFAAGFGAGFGGASILGSRRGSSVGDAGFGRRRKNEMMVPRLASESGSRKSAWG